MDIRQVIKWTLIVLTILVAPSARAEVITTSQSPIEVYRIHHDDQVSMPDHLAYLLLMQRMAAQSPEDNLADIQQHLDKEDTQALDFLDFMLESYSTMRSTNREVTHRMLCLHEQPRYEVGEAYAVLDVLDDIKETNLRKHLGRALIVLGPVEAEGLESWLADIKVAQRATTFPEHSVEDVIAKACNIVAQQ